MWIKDKRTQESYMHVCDGLTEKQMINKGIGVWLHDVSIFTYMKDEDRGVHIEHLKYCPYCGIELKDTVE